MKPDLKRAKQINFGKPKKNLKIDLRLQLLEPAKYSHLFKTLYGLLMLLPQSSAFQILKNRLNAVSPLGILQLIPKEYNIKQKKKNNNANFIFILLKNNKQ